MTLITDILAEELGNDPRMLNLDKLKTMDPQKLLEYFSTHPQFKSFWKEFEKALHLQVCFIIDVTGSMTNYSNFKNNTFGLILDSLFEFMNKKSKKRYAFIGYRERDEENVFVNFTDNLEEIRNKINTVKLNGGGDAAEDVEFAFKMFCDEIMFEQGGTRIIIHIADAPCHGIDYNDYTNEHDKHRERSNEIPKLLKKIACNYNCAYWFVKITDATDKMVQQFNEILQREAPTSEFNRIEELDLRGVRADLVKHILLENLLKTTLATALVGSRS